MTQETITRIKLIAAEGMTLTNGKTFGKEVYLGSGDKTENWQEITDAEAEEMKKAQEETAYDESSAAEGN